MPPSPLRLGILGAARIAPTAVVRPARHVEGVRIAAIAARDPARARAFADRHGIGRAHGSYEALLDDADVDAVYVPLPNALHAAWTIRALEAGKHVLCEKPIAANAAQAQAMADAAARTGRRLVEAFHWRYHALADRVIALVRGGEVGAVRHVEAGFAFPLPIADIRWDLSLAGGALMDAGCYAVSMVRHAAGEEPEVVRASALLRGPGVDRRTEADLRFPSGATGKVVASMWSRTLLRASLEVRGDAGRLRVLNPIAPQFGHCLTIEGRGGRRHERVAGEGTYTAQLRAFVAHVRDGAPVPTGPDDAVAGMRVIDAIYRAAGLQPRG
jgi:predicted dehydrogenase